MAKRSELRVHGVSGTPARDLLYWDPVSYLGQGEKTFGPTRIWERNRDDTPHSTTKVRAFHWGSLTSGSRLSAFWILLAPFAFSNVAGWTANGTKRTQALLRVSAIGLTALWAAQASVVGIDLTYQVAAKNLAGNSTALNAVAVLAPLVIGIGFLTMAWLLSTKSQLSPFERNQRISLVFGVSKKSLIANLDPNSTLDSQLEDPAEGAKLDDKAMWVQQPVLHRLRRLHLAAGVLVVALVVAWGSAPSSGMVFGGTAPDWISPLLLSLIVLALIAVIAATGFTSDTSPSQNIWVTVARFGVWGSVLILLLAVLFVDISRVQIGVGWPNTHAVVFFSAALILGAALIATFFNKPDGPRIGRWLPAGTVSIATLFGGALGVAAALFTEFAFFRFLPGINPFQVDGFKIMSTQVMKNGGDWVAVAMLTFLFGIAAIGAVIALRSESRENGLALFTSVTSRASSLVGLTGIVGVGISVLAGFRTCFGGTAAGCSPSELRLGDAASTPALIYWIAGLTAAAAVIALVLVLFRLNALASLGTAVIGGAALWLVWTPSPPFRIITVPVLELPVDVTELVDLSVLIMVAGFAYVIINSIVGSWGDPDKRRKVGILWDLGSFWPRWFHPLAPPAYGPAVVNGLKHHVRKQDPPMVLAAHSQGSVIAAVAIRNGVEAPNGLVTYGSPLGHLYSRLFPSVGVDELCAKLADQEMKGGHWINLIRATDPIGGSDVPGATNRQVETGTGHSGYELAPEYCLARKDVIAATGTPLDSVPEDCWET